MKARKIPRRGILGAFTRMKDITLIIRQEWTNFLRSDRSVFIVYGILVFAWSVVLATNMHSLARESNMLWWVFFSVIVSGNFSNTTFVSERLTGSLEIILTCGISRGAILIGKMIYVIIMSAALGFLCLAIGLCWALIAGNDFYILIRALDIGGLGGLYLSACYMNGACGAWLSVRLTNPRLSHFANLLVLGIVVGTYAVLSAVFTVSQLILVAALLLVGSILFALAARDFNSEKVVQPFSY